MDAFQQVPGPRPYPRTVTILASQWLKHKSSADRHCPVLLI